MTGSGNVQAARRIVASKMNTGDQALLRHGKQEMIKVALVALFVMSMGTLVVAASSLPVVDTAVAAELR